MKDATAVDTPRQKALVREKVVYSSIAQPLLTVLQGQMATYTEARKWTGAGRCLSVTQ